MRVENYGVELESLESEGLAAIEDAIKTKEFVVIDEIGPMQLYSEKFKRAVLDALASPRTMLGTIVARPYPWAEELKGHPCVALWPVTIENRDRLAEELTLAIRNSK
jgi:nucleoside-triphosphatase